jgi:hypothetical protein
VRCAWLVFVGLDDRVIGRARRGLERDVEVSRKKFK